MQRARYIFGLMLLLALAAVILVVVTTADDTGGNDPVACTLEAKVCPDGSVVGRTGPSCAFAPCPGVTEEWERYTDEEVSFLYPETLPGPYVTPIDWPPAVQLSDTPFLCTEAGAPTDRAGQTEEHIVHDQTYCVTRIVEGAAGSIYEQYAYAFQRDEAMVILTFSLRLAQCDATLDPDQCRSKQALLLLDTVIHEIAQSLTVR